MAILKTPLFINVIATKTVTMTEEALCMKFFFCLWGICPDLHWLYDFLQANTWRLCPGGTEGLRSVRAEPSQCVFIKSTAASSSLPQPSAQTQRSHWFGGDKVGK